MARNGEITRWKWNYREAGQLLRSPAMMGYIGGLTVQIAAAAGPGMRHQVYMGRDRVRGMVWTGTFEARQAEAKDRALSKAFGAQRRTGATTGVGRY